MTDVYLNRIERNLRDLGVPAAYAERGLPVCEEALDLVSVGVDIAGRERQLVPGAASAWGVLRDAAAADGVVLQLVSAFRSVDYQREIVERKLRQGIAIEDILRVNAAPGYSEHHTGRAIDLTTPGCAPLTEAFETTPAFAWLTQHAARFGFTMSYPRGNRYGIAYEPWHWSWNA